MITTNRIRELMDYDKETGIATWRVKPHPNSSRVPGEQIGSLNGGGYLICRIDRKWYRVHRLVWFYVFEEWPDVIDHINGDRTDNRLSNLRNTSVAGNNLNISKHREGSPPFLRYRAKEGKWEAYLTKRVSPTGKKLHLGTFNSKEEAEKKVAEQLKFHVNLSIGYLTGSSEGTQS